MKYIFKENQFYSNLKQFPYRALRHLNTILNGEYDGPQEAQDALTEALIDIGYAYGIELNVIDEKL